MSQGLFSSADVDAGTRLLLKVFSRILDDNKAEGKRQPRRILDCGCGAGIIGICAATALATLNKGDEGGLYVRCEDRDELARLITLHNAKKNDIPPSILEAYTEPLLAGPQDAPAGESAPCEEGGRWDLILTNIPAKAGAPVLEDFVRRSACLLNPGGRVIMVAVHTLADFFRERIAANLICEEKGQRQGPGHNVFVYGNNSKRQCAAVPVNAGPGFLTRFPFYKRTIAECEIEDIPVSLETIYGAGGFDEPGSAVLAAAALTVRLGPEKIPAAAPLLVHEPGQGFFPRWLLGFLREICGFQNMQPPVLSGRNILALEAARHNLPQSHIVPACDLGLGRAALLEASGGAPFGFIAAFPSFLPQSLLSSNDKKRRADMTERVDQLDALWESLPPLLAGGGIFLVACGSSDAERFDRKKPRSLLTPDGAACGFTRMGGIKRKGFRAMAYRLG